MSPEGTHPKISFEPQTIIRRNGHILEVDDFTPESLRDFVDQNEDIIALKIESMYTKAYQQARRPELVTRETILIARLALLSRQRQVLSSDALQSPSRFYDRFSDVSSSFAPYWSRLAETAFRPRIRTRTFNNTTDTSGVWLGVTLDTHI